MRLTKLGASTSGHCHPAGACELCVVKVVRTLLGRRRPLRIKLFPPRVFVLHPQGLKLGAFEVVRLAHVLGGLLGGILGNALGTAVQAIPSRSRET